MVDLLVQLAAVVTMVTFAWAAVAKVVDLDSWLEVVAGHEIPVPSSLIAFAIPPLEMLVVGLIASNSLRVGGALACALLAAFSMAIVRRSARQGKRLPCGCFGKDRTRDYRVMLLRNLVLGAAAATLMLGGEGVRVWDGLRAPSTGELLAASLVLGGIALGAWTYVNVRRSLRREKTKA